MEYSQKEAHKPRAKAEPKPTTHPLPSSPTEQIPLHGRESIDIEPQEHTLKNAQSYPVSKRKIALLRHGTIPRDEDGAIEFWRLKADFKIIFPKILYIGQLEAREMCVTQCG